MSLSLDLNRLLTTQGLLPEAELEQTLLPMIAKMFNIDLQQKVNIRLAELLLALGFSPDDIAAILPQKISLPTADALSVLAPPPTDLLQADPLGVGMTLAGFLGVDETASWVDIIEAASGQAIANQSVDIDLNPIVSPVSSRLGQQVHPQIRAYTKRSCGLLSRAARLFHSEAYLDISGARARARRRAILKTAGLFVMGRVVFCWGGPQPPVGWPTGAGFGRQSTGT